MSTIKTVLPFLQLPKGLPWNRQILYCIVDISGIQSYIFSSMDRSSTPEHIRHRSRYVQALSAELARRLREAFPKQHLWASVSSGKLLCAFSCKVDIAALEKLLQQLQRAVFASTQGKLTFYYAMCPAVCIRQDRFRADKMTHASAVLGPILEREKICCTNLLQVDMQKDLDPQLCRQALTPQDQVQTEHSRKDQGAIKLDLDNLGDFFWGMTAFDQRHQVSAALDRTIQGCLASDARITTIFAGGDDIFFLCDLECYLQVVADFYKRLKKTMLESPELSGYAQRHFGLSGGICAIRNRLDKIPLISYWESGEEALSTAKSRGGKNCICVQLPDKERRIISWEDFCLLAQLYERLSERLFSGRTVTGADLADVKWLADQLSIWSRRHKDDLTREELTALDKLQIQLL